MVQNGKNPVHALSDSFFHKKRFRYFRTFSFCHIYYSNNIIKNWDHFLVGAFNYYSHSFFLVGAFLKKRARLLQSLVFSRRFS